MLRTFYKIQSNYLWRFASGLLLIILSQACVRDSQEIKFGLRADHVSYIPARIAVLNCRLWPNGARYSGLPATNTEDQDIESLCLNVDAFVLQGFADQPYMRGISPGVVSKLLARTLGPEILSDGDKIEKEDKAKDAKDPTKRSGLKTDTSPGAVVPQGVKHYFDQIDKLWQHLPTDCGKCQIAPDFYTKSLQGRSEWLNWLAGFSKITQNSDAILIPFVTHVVVARANDRGMHVAIKRGGIALMMIDTNNGELLWSGGRDALVQNRSFPQEPERPNYPSWEELGRKLLTNDLWKDFPGRQSY